MFDAKSILEALMKGAAPQQAPAQAPAASGGGLGDLLGQLTKMAQAGQSGGQQGNAPAASPGGMGGLEDMLRKLMPQQGGPAQAPVPVPHAQAAPDQGMGGLPGGLAEILAKLQAQAGAAANNTGLGGGSIMDALGKVFAQATEGAREGAGKIGAATGATDALGKAMQGAGGADILAQLKALAAQHQMATGAAAGGLGAVVLGTQAGRSLAASAAKIGALALIGGLAYKAVLNYQNGKPLITGAHTVAEAAPQGTGFEPAAVTNESAVLYIKTMIAAAAADGRIDQGEMDKIMGGLKQGGFDAQAEEFLAQELNNPATTDDLAQACTSPELAVQVYTAARIAVAHDGGANDAFLADLAAKLGVDGKLAAHIDAAARNAA